MPISSQAISVKSSINLSDINIDGNLNMGVNDITIGGVNINDVFGKKVFLYSNIRGFPVTDTTIAERQDEFTINTPIGDASPMLSFTVNSAQNSLFESGFSYKIYQKKVTTKCNYSTGYKNKTIIKKSDNSVKYTDSTKQYSMTYNSYTTYSALADFYNYTSEIMPTPIPYNTAVKLTGLGSGNAVVCDFKELELNLCGKVLPLTEMVISDYSDHFSKILGVIMNNADSIKLDDLTYTNTQTQTQLPTPLSTGLIKDLGLEFEDLTTFQIMAGNPIFLFSR